MELSREEEYERFQKLYVRYETIPIQKNDKKNDQKNDQKNNQQTIDTIATIKNDQKNEIVIPEIQVPEEKNDQENLKEKIETIVCDTCGGRYSYFNRNRHINTKKHQNSLTLLSFPPSPLLEREQTVEGSSP